MDSRTAAFQLLKPTCVTLGEAAKALGTGRETIATVTKHLEKLKQALSSNTSKPNTLHPKLAEYVFFPISQVLRVSHKASIHSLELCLQCISILVDQGWQQHLPAPTAAQLIILCTLLAGKDPQGLPFTQTTDELQASAFWCLYHIFIVIDKNPESKLFLSTEAQFPQLGNTISVMLDGIEEVESPIAQVAASSALEALLGTIGDRNIHASFLPGIVSRLTRVLAPTTKARRSTRVLTQCLTIVVVLLQTTLSDVRGSKSTHMVNGDTSNEAATRFDDEAWLKKTTTQLKPALANIFRLRSHSHDDVQTTLAKLCLMLLRKCRHTLANCAPLAMETLVEICIDHRDGAISIELEMLLQASAITASLLQDLLYDWLRSLTTYVQSADDRLKVRKMQQVSMSYQLLAQAGADLVMISRTAAAVMRDSVVVTLTAPTSQQQSSQTLSAFGALETSDLSNNASGLHFTSPFSHNRMQEDLMNSIASFTEVVLGSPTSSTFYESHLKPLWQSSGETQIANFWLLLSATEIVVQSRLGVDSFIALTNENAALCDEGLEELYSFALTILNDTSEQPRDPRLQSIALRAIALRASHEGQAFRYELIDALYPVLHILATPVDQLQRDAIITLNIFSSTCGYTSVQSLIVDNVDYLTNAVALKLNAFDLSPQAPQVLLMMVRLAGPSLLPYLEDTVESIFAALADYHGYPLLVELLFKVLAVVAEEGVKAPKLAIEPQRPARNEDALVETRALLTIEGLAVQLQIRMREEAETNPLDKAELGAHPKRPWGEGFDAFADDTQTGAQGSGNNDQTDTGASAPPENKTYALLLKITDLTQHFLPAASSSLRTSLMGLIRTTAPALACHEDSFLPLINTLWPEIVARLEDAESHIVATALDIVSVLCECAGDFMRTRMIQLWPLIVQIYESVAQEVVLGRMSAHMPNTISQPGSSDLVLSASTTKQASAHGTRGQGLLGDVSGKIVWSALERAITTSVQHVRMPVEIFDQALDMMEPALRKESIFSAFTTKNSDATWLVFERHKAIPHLTPPPGHDGARWAVVTGPESLFAA